MLRGLRSFGFRALGLRDLLKAPSIPVEVAEREI